MLTHTHTHTRTPQVWTFSETERRWNVAWDLGKGERCLDVKWANGVGRSFHRVAAAYGPAVRVYTFPREKKVRLDAVQAVSGRLAVSLTRANRCRPRSPTKTALTPTRSTSRSSR